MASAPEDNPRHSLLLIPMAPAIRLLNPTAYMGLPRPLLVPQGSHFQEAWVVAHRSAPSNAFPMDPSISLLP